MLIHILSAVKNLDNPSHRQLQPMQHTKQPWTWALETKTLLLWMRQFARSECVGKRCWKSVAVHAFT